eukprot:6947357-Prorocentrum_lima.AAC.1
MQQKPLWKGCFAQLLWRLGHKQQHLILELASGKMKLTGFKITDNDTVSYTHLTLPTICSV